MSDTDFVLIVVAVAVVALILVLVDHSDRLTGLEEAVGTDAVTVTTAPRTCTSEAPTP